ncbi:hypothetical protein K439DRAFT_739372 [Ramaria rubella]|nr:hypothetical protein K439DRAFT_739372 [Ramaria rubella]
MSGMRSITPGAFLSPTHQASRSGIQTTSALCTNYSTRRRSLGLVLSAAVLPTPSGSSDGFECARPLLGILSVCFHLSSFTRTKYYPCSTPTHFIKQTSFMDRCKRAVVERSSLHQV